MSLPTADNRSRFQKYISDLLYSEFQQVLPEQDKTTIIQEEFTKLVEVHTTSGDTTDIKAQATKHFRRLFLNSATKKKVEDYIDNDTFFGSSTYTSLHHRYLAKAGEVIDEEIASRKTPSPEAPFYTAADTAFISEGGPSTFKPPSPIRRTEGHQLPTPSTGGPIVFESPSILYSREASPEEIQTSVATVIPPPPAEEGSEEEVPEVSHEEIDMEGLAQAIAVLAGPTTAAKGDLDIRKFFRKAKEVIPFISNVETARRANGWTDKKNPRHTLVKGEEHTPEELFARSIAQVNKVALHFRDAAAIWWQNLKDKPYTWEDLNGVAEMEVDEDTPG